MDRRLVMVDVDGRWSMVGRRSMSMMVDGRWSMVNGGPWQNLTDLVYLAAERPWTSIAFISLKKISAGHQRGRGSGRTLASLAWVP